MDRTELLLKDLTEAVGLAGFEREVAKSMEKHLKGYARVSHDKLGSVVFTKEGTARTPRVMLAGHMDEVGFIVKSITKEGFVKFIPVGGWWGHVVLGQRVLVRTRKGDLPGVVGSKPPHELDEDERKKVVQFKDMYIDVGATAGANVAKQLGVRPGDPIVPWSPFTVMQNRKAYMAKALDDRAGCAVVVEAIRQLAKIKHPNTVYGVGTVQEEVGLRGAATAVELVDPDVAFVIDVSIAHDMPNSKDEEQERLGAGPSITVYDGSMIPNPSLRDLVIETAGKAKIPFHYSSVERGGTDGGRIHMHRIGVPSLVLGMPTRYIHGHVGILHRGDFDATVRLLVAVIRQMDAKAVASLTK
jgi:putative aminopeptidase FrvX